MMTVSVIALGVDGCGDSSEPASTAATQAQSPTPDAADFLGATLTSTTAGEPGAVVQSVPPDNKSRLKPGDVIIAFNGTPVASSEDVIRALGPPKMGARFTIRIVRGSHRFTLTEVQSPTAYLGANVKDAPQGANGAVVEKMTATLAPRPTPTQVG
jgi:S1-C subfamily serine protease